MSIQSSFLLTGLSLSILQIGTATAVAAMPQPPYTSFDSYSTINTNNGNETDLYFPTLNDGTVVDNLPAVLLLQGALVDKRFYSDYASQVARYGFAVSVPNHVQSVPGLGDVLAPIPSSVQEGLDQVVFESNRSTSPLNGKIDTDKFGLLGHSLGGAAGLSAIGDICLPSICPVPFTRPNSLLSGAFFGANLRDENDVFPFIDNEGIGIALIQGNRDGRALPINAERTFDQIQTPPKALIELEGVNHFGITNVGVPEGAFPDPISQTVSQQTSVETIARWSGLFLRGTLQGDQAALDYVFESGVEQDPIVVGVEGQSAEVQSVPEPSAMAGVFGGLVSLLFWRKRTAASPHD